MEKPSFDPGFTQQYSGHLRRAINPDGSFNVVRRGTNWWDVHPYMRLVSIPSWQFFSVVLVAYTLVNAVFAVFYYVLGTGALQGTGAEPPSHIDRFLACFYFSAQTLTTVGFGAISPKSGAANMIAALEAMIGLLGFAIATGVLLGRVSKPSARIGFSPRAMMARYQDGFAFQFRIVNRRPNVLMELKATVLLMTVDRERGELRREFTLLKLERDGVLFLPLTWTIVHPVDRDSLLYGKTPDDLERLQAEFVVMIKGWDETFGQIVNVRYSYRFDEIVWNGEFAPAFQLNDEGDMVLEVGRVGAYKLPKPSDVAV